MAGGGRGAADPILKLWVLQVEATGGQILGWGVGVQLHEQLIDGGGAGGRDFDAREDAGHILRGTSFHHFHFGFCSCFFFCCCSYHFWACRERPVPERFRTCPTRLASAATPLLSLLLLPQLSTLLLLLLFGWSRWRCDWDEGAKKASGDQLGKAVRRQVDAEIISPERAAM